MDNYYKTLIFKIIQYIIMAIGLIICYPPVAIIAIIFLIIVIISLVSNTVAKIKLNLQRVTPEDFGMNKSYYRDIIEEYSLLVLGYINNFKIDNEEIVGTLLKLQTKKYIDIKNKRDIYVINNNTDKLKKTEKYVLENHIDANNYSKFKNLVEEEAISQGLLTYTSINKDKINKKIKWLVCILIISIIGLMVIVPIYSDTLLLNVLTYTLEFGIFYPIARITYLILYKQNIKKDPIIRTDKGNEINLKLIGLKNYIKDYSTLNKKNYEELVLWEDYLIYSVMFGQNKKIFEELKDIIK